MTATRASTPPIDPPPQMSAVATRAAEAANADYIRNLVAERDELQRRLDDAKLLLDEFLLKSKAIERVSNRSSASADAEDGGGSLAGQDTREDGDVGYPVNGTGRKQKSRHSGDVATFLAGKANSALMAAEALSSAVKKLDKRHGGEGGVRTRLLELMDPGRSLDSEIVDRLKSRLSKLTPRSGWNRFQEDRARRAAAAAALSSKSAAGAGSAASSDSDEELLHQVAYEAESASDAWSTLSPAEQAAWGEGEDELSTSYDAQTRSAHHAALTMVVPKRDPNAGRAGKMASFARRLGIYQRGVVLLRTAETAAHLDAGDKVSLAPPARKTPAWAIKQRPELVALIEAFWRSKCQPSPSMKHPIRRKNEDGEWEVRQKSWRRSRISDLYVVYTEQHPMFIVSPSAFRAYRPWECVKGHSETCLCSTCEAFSHFSGALAKNEFTFAALDAAAKASNSACDDDSQRVSISDLLECERTSDLVALMTCGRTLDDKSADFNLFCFGMGDGTGSCMRCGPSSRIYRDEDAELAEWGSRDNATTTVSVLRYVDLGEQRDAALHLHTLHPSVFLDYYTELLRKLVPHKYLIRRLKREAVLQSQNCKPSDLLGSMDFSENATFDPTRTIQSAYWITVSATIFGFHAKWLDRQKFEAIVGPLDVGAEVTVMEVRSAPFFATITESHSATDYTVVDNDGAEFAAVRRCLRHREFATEMVYVISDDPKHDSAFVQTALPKVINALTALATGNEFKDVRINSDNAAQHFKSNKTQEFLTRLGEEFDMRISNDYGAAGHGKSGHFCQ